MGLEITFKTKFNEYNSDNQKRLVDILITWTIRHYPLGSFEGLSNYLKSEAKKTGHFQKMAIIKKSMIFVLSSCNLGKMITSWVDHFHQVSWGYDRKCGFFTNG